MNFGLRLDDILDDLVEGCEDSPNTLGYRYDLGRKSKQAITSLIKELVAEAKPEKLNDELNYSTFGDGYDTAIDQFEQNLLKELEEV